MAVDSLRMLIAAAVAGEVKLTCSGVVVGSSRMLLGAVAGMVEESSMPAGQLRPWTPLPDTAGLVRHPT